MLYINDDKSIDYFSETEQKGVSTSDPFSISLRDFANFSMNERIELTKLRIKIKLGGKGK